LRFLLTRSASYADAEDAIQDTFINAYRYLASFDPRWRFSTWIYRIALRNIARQKRPEWSESAETLIGSDDPLQNCIDSSERDNVWVTARRLLSEDAFAAMWLRYVEDLSVKDISQALEKTQSWTKVTLLRGRRRLSDELAGDSLPAAQRESYG